MFFGHWEYIEEGGLGGWRRVLLYGDQSSRMISTFPSTTMPRELYAIRHTNRAGRSGTGEEDGKVAAGMVPKSYSNALSSECRGKLETILEASSTSLEKSEDRFEEGCSRRNGGGQAF